MSFEVLQELCPQESFWMALVVRRRISASSLVIEESADDPDGRRFGDLCQAALQRPYQRVYLGAANVGPSGAVTLCSRDPGKRFLPDLAEFIGGRLRRQPELRRLVGTRYVQLSPFGKPLTEFRDDELWEPFAVDVRLRQRQALGAELRKARVDDRFYFWLDVDGDVLLLANTEETAEATFVDQTAVVAHDLGRPDRVAAGSATVSRDGSFVFRTRTPDPAVLPSLVRMVRDGVPECPELGLLLHARHRHPDGAGGATEQQADWSGIEPPPMVPSAGVQRRITEVLGGAADGDVLLFHYVPKSASGEAAFVFSRTDVPKALERHREAMNVLVGDSKQLLSQPVGGTLLLGDPPRFTVRREPEAFEQTVSTFVAAQVDRVPALRRLRGAVAMARKD